MKRVVRLFLGLFIITSWTFANMPVQAPTIVEWNTVHTAYIQSHTKLLNTYKWIDNKKRKKVAKECLFAERKSVKPGTQIYFFGDLHGDYEALNAGLYALRKVGAIGESDRVSPDTLLVFLGDYVDRGLYGIEILQKLKQLAIDNPHQVILLRGNHEDLRINNALFGGSFLQEITDKYPEQSNEVARQCAAFYHKLPVVLYLDNGTSVIQSCHGWMEIGYNPFQLLSAELHQDMQTICQPITIDRQNEYELLTAQGIDLQIDTQDQETFTYLTQPNHLSCDNGFMWGDCNQDPHAATRYIPGRNLHYGKIMTEALMAQFGPTGRPIVGLIRGHQHNKLLPAILDRNNHGTVSVWGKQFFTTIMTPAMLKLEKQQRAACIRVEVQPFGWKIIPLYLN